MRRFSEVQTSRETSRAFISSPQLARKYVNLLHANAKICSAYFRNRAPNPRNFAHAQTSGAERAHRLRQIDPGAADAARRRPAPRRSGDDIATATAADAHASKLGGARAQCQARRRSRLSNALR